MRFNKGKTNKYRAKPTTYNGRRYHSKAEANYAAQLDLLMKAKGLNRIVSWTPQVKIPLHARDQLIGCYVADFEVHYGNGRHEYHEVKGAETALWKWKKKHFEAEYPGVTLKVIR